jgi:hypothetical protein
MTADANNNITLGGLTCGTTYHYKVTAKSTSDVELASADQTFTTSACATPIIPTVVLNGSAIVSAYSVTDANTRFGAGVQFTVVNDALVTVNGSSVAPLAGVVTAATNSESKTLGAHVYNIVVTSSTGNTAELTIAYQVNADTVVPVIPTISLVGPSITSTYVLADADTRFTSGLQFNIANDALVTSNGATIVPVAGVADPSGVVRFCAAGRVDGTLAREERGDNGFAYDKIFIPDGYDQTLAELGDAIKTTISHRARAFAALVSQLSEQNKK